ncbi:MAG: hypothetical protein IT379_17105 [Deltaproteobacteria bacterium]|nr:hypothetical protein [Deltaproteobacteria bacterium]
MTSDARRTLRVDTIAIAEAMDMSDEHRFRNYLDLQTGEVALVCLERMSFDRPDPVQQSIEDEPDRYVLIPATASRDEYELMHSFAEEMADRRIRDRALDALRGKGAFSRFKHLISQHPELRDAWYARRDEWLVGEATRWLRSEGLEPVLPSRVAPGAPAPAPAPPSARLELLHVLLLGGASGASDRVDGCVRRRVRTRRPEDAHTLFVRLARDLCELRGIPWRDQLTAGKSTFEVEDIRLDTTPEGIEVTVRVPDDVARAFAAQTD